MLCPHCNKNTRSDVNVCTHCHKDWLIEFVLDGRYKIHSFVDVGGMGKVYRARDLLLDYEVAVKLLMLPSQAEGGQESEWHERFRREAMATACSSSHPNVVTVHYVSDAREDQPAYIVMGYVEGESLHELLKREKKLSPERAVALMLEICAGVGAAHRNKVLHRDLKPKNVIVIAPDQLRQHETVKVVDFGIAQLRGLFDGLARTRITQLDQRLGSPAYMSPEQCRGEELNEDDYSPDVYSLGIMLYEMLKGECPFTGSSQEIYNKHLHELPPPLNVPQVPAALERVIMSALEKESSKRPADAIEFGLQILAAWQEAKEAEQRRIEGNQLKARKTAEALQRMEVELLKKKVAEAERYVTEAGHQYKDAAEELEQSKNIIARMNFELRSAQNLAQAEIRQRAEVESTLQLALTAIDDLVEGATQLRARTEAEIARLRDEVQSEKVNSPMESMPLSTGVGSFIKSDRTMAGAVTKVEQSLEDELRYIKARLDSALLEIEKWKTAAEAAEARIDTLSAEHEAQVGKLLSEYELVKTNLVKAQQELRKYADNSALLSTSDNQADSRLEERSAKPTEIVLLFRRFSHAFLPSNLAVDMGTSNTIIFARGRGIVVSEPSIVAINKILNIVEAVGRDAKEMLGRTPGNIIAIRPIKDGVVGNFEAMDQMLRQFIRKAHKGRTWVSPRVVIGMPSGITKAERLAVEASAYHAKACEVHLVEKAMAAAIGAGVPITEPHGNMVVDIGGGTTDIAVISLSDIVYWRSVRVASYTMDEAIAQYLKRKYNLLIGDRTAEALKIAIGSAWEMDEPLSMEVRGRDLAEGVPKTIMVLDEEIREALADCVSTIVNAVRVALERTPPELSADIVERGILMTGGGALLKNFDKRLSIETGIPVDLAEDPLSSTVLGMGKMLSDDNLLERVRWKNNGLAT